MKIRFLVIFFSMIFVHCGYNLASIQKYTGLRRSWTDSVPSQPKEEYMKFIDDLKSPLWTKHNWCTTLPARNYINIEKGVAIQKNFPDSKDLLATAYDDLETFLKAGNIPVNCNRFVIETVHRPDLDKESFIIETDSFRCKISSGDTEGIRRGIFYLEDQMLKAKGPFLEIGTLKKAPDIRRRISRCAFGPIKRLPLMRDELMDTVNYYPDNYLNRLAHEGVNGLWLTVEFKDLVSSPYTIDGGKDAEKRLKKLSNVVNSCLRYGIRTYIFCIEPRLHVIDVEKYPVFRGSNGSFFCPSSQDAYNYLYETVKTIFTKVPDLGGMINISHGERGTTCLSSVPATSPYEGKIDCPRCKNKKPWEILYASLLPMEKGMHDVSPEAELISWLYMPQPQNYIGGDDFSLGSWVYDIPSHTPPNVILQFNFESGVTKKVFDKLLVGGDYWISTPGPSDRFVKIATVAKEKRTSTSAKIQTGNSHEMATVPYIPVPTLLYRKFDSMKQLGVTHTMLSWYFGSYPGLMNKGAGLLSVNSYADVKDFLESLASIYWKKEDIPIIIEAWTLFGEAYSNYPLTNTFQYYGPMHDGIVWPLYLIPQDKYLSPTWLLGSSSQADVKVWPPSGDRIGECLGWNLTLGEVVVLCKQMADKWEEGIQLLNGIEKKYQHDNDRMLDFVLARAIQIHLKSSYNILRFYLTREKMFRTTLNKEKMEMLVEMEHIVHEEIKQSEEMISLCLKDSRLGYHSEAEGYKYYPEKLKWRIEQLNSVLINEFPTVRQKIANNEKLFPEYTGAKPEGLSMNSVANSGDIYETAQKIKNWLSFDKEKTGNKIRWASAYDETNLYFIISDEIGVTEGNIQVEIEPRRLWPVKYFNYAIGENNAGYQTKKIDNKTLTVIAIPFSEIGNEAGQDTPIRINLQYGSNVWIPKKPLPARLLLGNANPRDLGWVLFK